MTKTLLTLALAVAPLTFAGQQSPAPAKPAAGATSTSKPVVKKHHKKAAKKDASATPAAAPAKK